MHIYVCNNNKEKEAMDLKGYKGTCEVDGKLEGEKRRGNNIIVF